MSTDTTASASAGGEGESGFGRQEVLRAEATLPRPQRSSSIRISGALGIETDRFDHEVEFAVTVDPARYAGGHSKLDALGISEDKEPVNALRVAVPQPENRMRRLFRRRGRNIWRCTIVAPGAYRGKRQFRNCFKVPTASPPMGSATRLHGRRYCSRFIPALTRLISGRPYHSGKKATETVSFRPKTHQTSGVFASALGKSYPLLLV